MNQSNDARATTLNNEGISFINSRQYDEAISSITRGLALVRQVLAEQDDNDSYFEDECDPVSPACFFLEVASNKPKEMKISNCTESIREQTPFAFQNPLYINTQVPARRVVCLQYFVELSFILIYNLALAHHMSALRDTTPLAERKFMKALSLYEFAYSIQMTEEIQLSVLQTMAIFNNMGQIHSSLNNVEKSEICFQHLLSTIMFVNDMGAGERDAVDQMDDFLGNVMALILKDSSAAAA
jgi:tetratricopeptide (TPR) repeat protein